MRKITTILILALALAVPCWADALTEASLRIQMLRERQARLQLITATVKDQLTQTDKDLAAAVEQYKNIVAEQKKAQEEANKPANKRGH